MKYLNKISFGLIFNKPDSDYLSKFIFYIINKNKISCTLPNPMLFFKRSFKTN